VNLRRGKNAAANGIATRADGHSVSLYAVLLDL
jgi:hypothetical protein